jgi:hypothetical protein
MLPNHDVFRADRVRGSRARATAGASVRAEDGQQRLADMSACAVSGTVACVLIPGSVASFA